MAIAKSGLLRGLRGKTSGLVVYQTKQGTVVREYKDKITNPRTRAQVSNRNVFKAAVSTSSTSLSEIGKMYGTNRMPSYSKLISMVMRNIGGKSSRSFKNGILSPVLPMYNHIGINNDDIGLNIFNLKYAEIDPTGKFFTLGSKLHIGSESTFYFGSDYALDNCRLILVGLNSVYTFNVNFEFERIGAQEGGTKNMGYYNKAEYAGLGWKYIYKRTGESNSSRAFRVELSKSETADLFRDDIYEGNSEGRKGNYVYMTALLVCRDGEAEGSKQGAKFLSSGNFYHRLPDASGNGTGTGD